MTKKAPGKAHREGLTLVELFHRFPDDATAKRWFTETRWPDGPHCPHCGSLNVLSGAKHPTMPYRCRERECRKRFSVRSGTVMQDSNLGFQIWAIAIYLSLTSLKSISSMKLHRDLGVTQKTAWHLAHRLRAAYEADEGEFTGPVEADETYIGGKRKNMHASRRRELKGRGAVGKTAVADVKDRETKQIRARVIESTDAATLQGFVGEHAAEGATVYTDEARAYQGMTYTHEAVAHGVGEYVRGMAHTNGMESFWSMLKRAHGGTFHKMSPKHLDRYVQEFAGRHNVRDRDTGDQMTGLVVGMDGKRLRYADLIADNGLDSGARAK